MSHTQSYTKILSIAQILSERFLPILSNCSSPMDFFDNPLHKMHRENNASEMCFLYLNNCTQQRNKSVLSETLASWHLGMD